jgi:RecA-family ATPase
VSTTSFLLIFLGIFLGAGVYSFWKQKMPKGVIVLLAICAVMSLAAGLLRI